MVGKTLVKQSKLMKNGALASVLFLFSSFISAQTYYVDASKGNDNNSGTSILVPWQSLDKVSNQQFYPGDNILFKAGEQWTGSLTLSSSGAKDLPITYGSYGDLQNFGKPYINGNGKIYNHTGEAKNESIIIFAKNKEFIHLENLKVSADSFDVTGIKSTTGIYFGSDIKRQLSGFKLTNVTVQDVFQSKIDDPKRFNKKGKRIRVSKGKSFAVRFQSKYPTDRNARFNNILVENSTITNNQREGLRFIGADNIVIRNNTFYKNGGSAAVVNNYYDLTFENNDCQYSGAGESTGDDIRMHNRGSSLWTVFGEKALVRNNTFKHSRGWLDSYGMHVDHNNKDVIVEKNYFEDNEGGFIQIIGDNQDITYRYNVSVNDGLDLNQNNRTASTIHFSDYVGQDKKTGKKKPGTPPALRFITTRFIYRQMLKIFQQTLNYVRVKHI